jgi:hypothetical protein
MTTEDMFYLNFVFVTPERTPTQERVVFRAQRPEASVAIVAQLDGHLRFEVYPISGVPALKQVAPKLSPGCHWLWNVREKNGKLRIKLTEVGYPNQSEPTEAPYDYEQARNVIANMFTKG